MQPDPIAKAEDPARIVAGWIGGDRRVLLLGPSGAGKSTLAAGLAAVLADQGHDVWCLGTDPGAPAFGPPGAVGLARWSQGAWMPARLVPLCTLDAARFRLPLLSAAAELARSVDTGALLLDTPGLARGVAGAELLEALVASAAIDLILVLRREGQPRPLRQELQALANGEATPPSKSLFSFASFVPLRFQLPDLGSRMSF